MCQRQPLKVGEQCLPMHSVLHKFLLSYAQSALYDPASVSELAISDRIRISTTRAGKPHLVCYNSQHYEVAQVITELPANPYDGPRTEIRIRRVGRCNGWCGWAPIFSIASIFRAGLGQTPLLETIGALAEVPEGVVLYQVNCPDESSYLEYYEAGRRVPHFYHRTFKRLVEGESVQTTQVTRYGAFGARPVWTWYTHTNHGGKIITTSRGG